MARAKALTYEEFTDYAKQHYSRGGDSFYECWDEKDFNYYVANFHPITKRKALEMFRDRYAVDQEYQKAAKWYGGF